LEYLGLHNKPKAAVHQGHSGRALKKMKMKIIIIIIIINIISFMQGIYTYIP
jgi:hypothetical protein